MRPTLAELAALAAKVPGFKRPLKYCDECDDPMEFPGKTRDEYGQTRTCGWCDGTGALFNNSPAALLMAVSVLPGHSVEKHPGRLYVAVSCESGVWGCDHDGTSEGIARAALMALLRAHGVEVQDD